MDNDCAYINLASPSAIKSDYPPCQSVLHINTRSVMNKEDDILLFLEQLSFKVGVLMLSETWYTNNSSKLKLPGYASFFSNRSDKRGGGVALYVTTEKKCHLVHEYCVSTEDYEMLTVSDQNEMFAVVYRPPGGNIRRFLAFYESFLDFTCKNNFHLTCGGDFNINILDDSTTSTEFGTLLSSSGFKNLITTPTRITCGTLSCLDHLIINAETKIYTTGTVTSDISDHLPVYALYENQRGIRNREVETFTVQRITDSGLVAFKTEIMAQDWSSVLALTSADEAYNEFIEKFIKIYERHFPMKQVKPPKKSEKTMGNERTLENDFA